MRSPGRSWDHRGKTENEAQRRDDQRKQMSNVGSRAEKPKHGKEAKTKQTKKISVFRDSGNCRERPVKTSVA